MTNTAGTMRIQTSKDLLCPHFAKIYQGKFRNLFQRYLRYYVLYEGRSKSNKTRVTAPFIKSVDKTISHNGKLGSICSKNTKFEGVIRNERKIMTK